MNRSFLMLRASRRIGRMISLMKEIQFVQALDGVRWLLVASASRSQAARMVALATALRRLAYHGPLQFSSRLARRLRRIASPDRRIEGADDRGVGTVELATSIVLMAPTETQKGVLYMSFESNWQRLVDHGHFHRVLHRFHLVGATSWSPTDFGLLARLPTTPSSPFFACVSNDRDMRAFETVGEHIVPMPLLASDWVDPSEYHPREFADRDIDIAMVAHWASWKRHWMLFDALRSMPSHLKVVIVGHNSGGRTADDVLQEARAFGVRQQITTFTNVSAERVRGILCRSRVLVACSLREGSCVAIAEALAADCAVVALAESHVGALKYINAQTGVVSTRADFAASVLGLLDRSAAMRPRAWYSENSGCWNSSSKLKYLLSSWLDTSGMASLKWTYVPSYANNADDERLQGARDELREKCGVELKAFTPPLHNPVVRVLHDGISSTELERN